MASCFSLLVMIGSFVILCVLAFIGFQFLGVVVGGLLISGISWLY